MDISPTAFVSATRNDYPRLFCEMPIVWCADGVPTGAEPSSACLPVVITSIAWHYIDGLERSGATAHPTAECTPDSEAAGQAGS